MERLKPIFVVYTQDTCPHCQRFVTNDYAELKRRVESSGSVSLYLVETGRSRPLDLNLYPEDLSRHARMVPSFILINPYSWRRRERLEVEIYGQGDPSKPVKPYTVDNLMEWIRETGTKPSLRTDTGPRMDPRLGGMKERGRKSGYEMTEIF